jgi:hypothetical protein
MAEFRRDDRAVSAVVGKTLAIGLALLYVAGMMSVLYGGVVPEYRTQTGAEIADRVLATAAGNLERAPPAVRGTVDTHGVVELPATIRQHSYTLVLSNRTLTLDHPERGVGAETRLGLPENVTVDDGTWHSGSDLVIRVRGPADDRRLTIDDTDSTSGAHSLEILEGDDASTD